LIGFQFTLHTPHHSPQSLCHSGVYLSLPHFTLELFLVSGDIATGKFSGFCFGYGNQIKPHQPEFIFLIELEMNQGIQLQFIPTFGLRRPNSNWFTRKGQIERPLNSVLVTKIELSWRNSISREIEWIWAGWSRFSGKIKNPLEPAHAGSRVNFRTTFPDSLFQK